MRVLVFEVPNNKLEIRSTNNFILLNHGALLINPSTDASSDNLIASPWLCCQLLENHFSVTFTQVQTKVLTVGDHWVYSDFSSTMASVSVSRSLIWARRGSRGVGQKPLLVRINEQPRINVFPSCVVCRTPMIVSPMFCICSACRSWCMHTWNTQELIVSIFQPHTHQATENLLPSSTQISCHFYLRMLVC